MRLKISPEQAVGFTKFGVKMIASWPPDKGAGKWELFLLDVTWWTSVSIALTLMVPLILAVYKFSNDPITTSKSLSELMPLGQAFANMILCRIERQRFQALISEMMQFIKTATPLERTLLQKYVDRCAAFHVFLVGSSIIAIIAFSCGPFITSRPFPGDTWYPFSVDSLPVVRAIYVLQVLAIVQAGLCIVVDFKSAMLLWYSAARLELLGMEFRRVTNMAELKRCVQKHQDLMKYVEEVKLAVRLIILKTPAAMSVSIACGSLQLCHHNQPLPVVAQFIFLVAASCLELFICAWPADKLMQVSENLAWSVYNSPWVGSSHKMRKSMQIVIQRCQKPLVIQIPGIIPVLSLKFYASFLTTAFSYFTKLRAVIGE